MSNISQSELIAKFVRDKTPRFNENLFNKSDEDIIEALKKVILSIQRSRTFTIRVVKFRVVDEYFEIQKMLRDYEETTLSKKNKNRSANKKKENPYDYINLKDSDIKLLIVTYFISIKGVSTYLDVYIAIPRIIDKFYMKLSGSVYSPMYQILEASTYNNTTTTNSKKDNVTLRTLFSNIIMTRDKGVLKTVDKEEVPCRFFIINAYRPILCMKYILGNYGLYGTLDLFNFSNLILIEDEDYTQREDWYTFNRSNIYVSVPKEIYDADFVFQSLVYTILDAVQRHTESKNMFTKEFWLRSLGLKFNNDSVEKGLSVLDSLEHVYDISTREITRLPDEMKQDIYHIAKWLMCEFANLRMKDNLDTSMKRVRFSEHIAAHYAKKLNSGLYRIQDQGNRADIDSIRKAISTRPMYLIEEIQKDKLVNYRDLVNDCDSFSALKFTYKGIGGIGEKSTKAIPDSFRAVNPSHIGRIDLNTSSASDPGMTGILCPLGKTYDYGFFSDYQEPNTWDRRFSEIRERYMDRVGRHEVELFKIEIDKDKKKKLFQIVKRGEYDD